MQWSFINLISALIFIEEVNGWCCLFVLAVHITTRWTGTHLLLCALTLEKTAPCGVDQTYLAMLTFGDLIPLQNSLNSFTTVALCGERKK